MKTIDFSYFIERYNTGEMDTIERKWFEKELSGNGTLQQEVKLRKKMDDALIRHDIIALRNKLTTLEKERKEKQTAASGRRKNAGIRFAAAIASLVVLGSIYVLTMHTSQESLYDSMFRPYEISLGARSLTSSSDAVLQNALELYLDQDYQNAAVAFKTFLESNPEEMEARVALGVSEMKISNYGSAESELKSVIDGNNNLYIDHANWYLALCYYKTGRTELAIEQFEGIKNSETVYKTRAAKFLRRLK